MTVAEVGLATWISIPEATRRLGISRDAFTHLFKRGILTYRKYPGGRVQLLESDVERLRLESIRPATRNAN